MKIKQGGVTLGVPTSSIDEITFAAFTCGDVILYGGDQYPTISINGRCWFQKNLNAGTKIAGSVDQTNNNIIEKYCLQDIDANCNSLGGLYSLGEAASYASTADNLQGICPGGWHLPTMDDFTSLGSSANALKAIGQGSNEFAPTYEGAGTNTTGFTALLTGLRYSTGTFLYVNQYAGFYGAGYSAEHPGLYPAIYILYYTDEVFLNYTGALNTAVNIRCVMN